MPAICGRIVSFPRALTPISDATTARAAPVTAVGIVAKPKIGTQAPISAKDPKARAIVATMTEYVLVKTLHIVVSTILFGTGIGSAFYMLLASLQQDAVVTHFVVRRVVIADWLFTTPAVILQPATGVYLAYVAGFPWSSTWLAWSIALYVVAGVCWLPVVWLQIRMRDLAAEAASNGSPLPPAYRRYFKVWFALGVPAFFALVVVFYLMVAKPA